jgi:outer membrane usher protein
LIFALALSVALERPPDPPAGLGEPMHLQLSTALTPPEEIARTTSAPFALRLAVALPYIAPPVVATPPVAGGKALRPVFYAVRINGQQHGVARLLVTPDGHWLARRADLQEWRLTIPAATPVLYAGEEHFPLDAYAGLSMRVNEAAQALDIESPPQFFAGAVLDSAPARTARAATPSPGAFFNYDVFLNTTSDAAHLGGLFEGAFFNRLGVGTMNFLAQDVGSGTRGIRLDTTWRSDFPDSMKTLLLGDAIGSSGSWGRPVRYGGVRYGTNFATNPGLITFPLPELRGEAVLPTSTELYVDGVRRQTTEVQPGPFRITNLPVVTGQGEVRLVVRDLLGREQIVSLPYYASTALLKPGLTDDSFEAGFVREDFGIRSSSYGRFVSAFQRRMGLTENLTAEARAEVLRDLQALGGGASYSVPSLGVFAGAGAASHGGRGNGALALAAFERQVRKGVSVGARSQWTTADFTQLGVQPGQRAPIHLANVNVGTTTPMGSLGAAYVIERNRDTPNVEIASLSYTVNVARWTTLIAFALKPIAGGGHSAVGVTLSIGLGERTSASLSLTAQRDANEAVAQIQQNLPPGTGFGYRALAGYGSLGDREEAGVTWQTDVGTYTAEAGRADDRTAFRASAAGGIVTLGGRTFFSRTVTESFGVAHVPGFADVGILLNNQIVARTDAQGYAMLPRLLPYQSNIVRVDTGDLPLDTGIEAAEMDAVPYYRSGVLLKFPIERAHGALVTIVLEDRKPMPVGSVVTLEGSARQFPVAERGEVYVTGLAEKNRIHATFRGQSCDLAFELAASERQPRIGPLVCTGVRR